MTGASRRTGKREAVAELARVLGVEPPASPGGTVPKSWLRRVFELRFGAEELPDNANKADVLRRFIALAGGRWDPAFAASSGGTITGHALNALTSLLSATNDGEPSVGEATTPSSILASAPNGADHMAETSDGQDPQGQAEVTDPRIHVMLSILQHLGQPIDPLPTHKALLTRLYEDDRFVGAPAPEAMGGLVLGLVQACEDVSEDDLEIFLEDDEPTLFCYELIQSCIEAFEPRPSENRMAGDADGEQGDDGEEDDSDDVDSADTIEASVTTIAVNYLFSLVETGRLDLQPPWQRKDVWSLKKKRELIKSLLHGIPLPSIILHQKGSNRSIIDGKQRLSSIMGFMQNDWKLPNFDVPAGSPLFECRGAWYRREGKKSLPEGIRTDFEMRLIPALIFVDVPEGRLRKIFHLYNVSGTQLNAAEINNAVFQANEIHRATYILAGEATTSPPNLGTGNYEEQLAFTQRFHAVLPGWHRRYAGVYFLCRYLAYSRAAQKDPTQHFTLPTTRAAINRYFDFASESERPGEVARDIIHAFSGAERFFDIDDQRMPFHNLDANGKTKFSGLLATTHMIAARFLLDAISSGVTDEASASEAARALDVALPEGQQTATIWDYQARVLTSLRESLEVDPGDLSWEGWGAFFTKMSHALLPPGEN